MSRNSKFNVVVVIVVVILFCGTVAINSFYKREKVVHINQVITPETVQVIFDEMKANRNYRLIINSPGGGAFDMLGILNRIEELQTKGYRITTKIYGYDMSAGAIIFLAGDERIVHSDAVLMVHCARMNSGFSTMTIKAEGLDDITKKIFSMLDGKIVRMLREKTNLTDQVIEDLLYKIDATFLTAEEALGLGLATLILKD